MRNTENVPIVVAKLVRAIRLVESLVGAASIEDCPKSGDNVNHIAVPYAKNPNVAKGISVKGIVEYGPVNTSAQDPTAPPSSVLPHIREKLPYNAAFNFTYVKYAVSRTPIDATLPIIRRN